MNNKEEKGIREEIRKEFQLDRMILFSDAVFAIVITLMAIEIRIPPIDGPVTREIVTHHLLHLVPTVIAYAASFSFIGQIWYQHLQVFGLLKDYDKGLVIRNLLLLFLVGLFPFSITVITQLNSSSFFLPALIYFTILFLCKVAQLSLQYYILVKKPNLRVHSGVHEELIRFKKSRLAVAMLLVLSILTSMSLYLIPDPQLKYMAWWWFFPFPFVLKYFQKRIK